MPAPLTSGCASISRARISIYPPMAESGLFDVAGKVACVTGASGGLGRRAATVLAQAGAKVVGVARRAEALADWRAEAGGETAAVVGDVADRTALADLTGRIAAPYGPPDILVH